MTLIPTIVPLTFKTNSIEIGKRLHHEPCWIKRAKSMDGMEFPWSWNIVTSVWVGLANLLWLHIPKNSRYNWSKGVVWIKCLNGHCVSEEINTILCILEPLIYITVLLHLQGPLHYNTIPFPFLVSCAKKITVHFAPISESWVPTHKIHGFRALKLACAPIWPYPMLGRSNSLIWQPLPMFHETMLYKQHIMLLII
jgi:hypothetical protein